MYLFPSHDHLVVAPMQLERYKKAGIDIRRQRPENCDILFIGSVWRRPKQVRARLTVQQVHADWTDKFWDGAKEAVKLLGYADKECDVFLPVSKSAASFVKKHTTKPIIVMNNLAPEQTKITHVKNNKLVIAAFTRMSKEKGLKNYQALRKRITELGIDAEFRVYTNGEAPKGS